MFHLVVQYEAWRWLNKFAYYYYYINVRFKKIVLQTLGTDPGTVTVLCSGLQCMFVNFLSGLVIG